MVFNGLSTKSKHMFAKGLSNLGSGAMKLSKFSTGARMAGDIAQQAGELIDPSGYSGSAGQVIDTGIERAKRLQKGVNKLIKYAQ
jgi:hypothetical protein